MYIENLGFDPEFSNFSLGMVCYYFLIEDSINSGISSIYLGDGTQEYKRRYNGINQLAFDGIVDRKITSTEKENSITFQIIKKLIKSIKKLTTYFFNKCL